MKKNSTATSKGAKNSNGMAIVEYVRNGKTYCRIKHSSINKATENMKSNRSQFASRQAVLTKFADAFKIGFDQLRLPGQTGYNAGISFNTAHAVADGVVDLNMLQLSQGALPGVKITSCAIEGDMLNIEWQSQVACNESNGKDLMYLCVAKESMDERPISIRHPKNTRDLGHCACSLPKGWDGETLYIYAFTFRPETGISSTTAIYRLEK